MIRITLAGAIAAALARAAASPDVRADDAPKPVCLRSYLIDHTEIPNDRTILFHMRGHKVYKADLVNQCVGLRINTRGFTYEPTNPGTDEICSNLLTIRLNDTGQVCLVGAITPAGSDAKAATQAQ